MFEIGYTFKLSIEFAPTMENFARHLAAFQKECDALDVNPHAPVSMYETDEVDKDGFRVYAIEVGLFSDAENYRATGEDAKG